jgi:hypothetical protein
MKRKLPFLEGRIKEINHPLAELARDHREHRGREARRKKKKNVGRAALRGLSTSVGSSEPCERVVNFFDFVEEKSRLQIGL